ncbi:unnamed protein product, partial [Gadus morhua 'NCC']
DKIYMLLRPAGSSRLLLPASIDIQCSPPSHGLPDCAGLWSGSYRQTLIVKDRLGYGIVHLPRVFLIPY